MSPESLINNQYSYKSDIWALGVTLFEMIFGYLPWQAQTEKELGEMLLSIPVPLPTECGVSLETRDLLEKMLKVNL